MAYRTASITNKTAKDSGYESWDRRQLVIGYCGLKPLGERPRAPRSPRVGT
jgi:hypothetical protein